MNGVARVLPAVRIHLALFAYSGAIFGLITGLVAGSAAKGLSSGAIFGSLFALIIGTAAIAGHRGRSGPISPRQQIALRLDADADCVRQYAVQALGAVSPRPVGGDRGGRLVVRTPFSWRSAGEVVDVELRADGPSTDVVIRSRPVVPVTLADYGKGRDNVDAVDRGLQLQLSHT